MPSNTNIRKNKIIIRNKDGYFTMIEWLMYQKGLLIVSIYVPSDVSLEKIKQN